MSPITTKQPILAYPPKSPVFLNVQPDDLSERIFLRAIENSLIHPGAGAQVATIRRVYLSPIEVRRKVLATHFCFEITVAGGVGTLFRCGIYNDGGRGAGVRDSPEGASLLWDSGNQNANVTGDMVVPIGTSLDLFSGLYWVCVVFDNAVSTFRRWANANLFNTMLDGCRYALGAWGALISPCPAVTRLGTSAKIALLVSV